MKLNSSEYYQTVGAEYNIYGSLSSIEMINDSDLIFGRMPEKISEIVIDKMIYDKTNEIEMIGLYELSRMIGKSVSASKLDFRILTSFLKLSFSSNNSLFFIASSFMILL